MDTDYIKDLKLFAYYVIRAKQVTTLCKDVLDFFIYYVRSQKNNIFKFPLDKRETNEVQKYYNLLKCRMGPKERCQ